MLIPTEQKEELKVGKEIKARNQIKIGVFWDILGRKRKFKTTPFAFIII